MRYCNNCGENITEEAKFCPTCGTNLADSKQAVDYKPPVTETPIQDNTKATTPQAPVNPENSNYIPYNPYNSNFYQQPEIEKSSGKINVGMLVWSIINTLSCCTPLGIISLIFTIIATSASSAAEEKSKVKTALILNIIGTASFFIIIVLYIVLFVLLGVSGAFDEQYY